MKEEQFKYGELVEVRNHDLGKWERRCYIATAPKGTYQYLTVMPDLMQEGVFREAGAWVYPSAQIRKIQKPEPKPQVAFVTTPEEAVMRLQERINKFEAILNAHFEKIKEQFDSIKNQLK